MNNMMSLLGEIQVKKILQSQSANASLDFYISLNVYAKSQAHKSFDEKNSQPQYIVLLFPVAGWFLNPSMVWAPAVSYFFLLAC